MTAQTDGAIPEWTLGWRMQRALDFAGIKAEEMAQRLDVSRHTVSRWMNDHGAKPKYLYVREWATLCGVDVRWLELGVGADPEQGSRTARSSTTAARSGRAVKETRTRVAA